MHMSKDPLLKNMCPLCGRGMYFLNCPVTEANGNVHCLGCPEYKKPLPKQPNLGI